MGAIIVRPGKLHLVRGGVMSSVFQSKGMLAREPERVTRPIEGLEALPLSDLEKLGHDTVVPRMNVSWQSFAGVLC
jgi:predicted DNA-binding protein (UPF0251 family)